MAWNEYVASCCRMAWNTHSSRMTWNEHVASCYVMVWNKHSSRMTWNEHVASRCVMACNGCVMAVELRGMNSPSCRMVWTEQAVIEMRETYTDVEWRGMNMWLKNGVQ